MLSAVNNGPKTFAQFGHTATNIGMCHSPHKLKTLHRFLMMGLLSEVEGQKVYRGTLSFSIKIKSDQQKL
jgi:hypothetical protein